MTDALLRYRSQQSSSRAAELSLNESGLREFSYAHKVWRKALEPAAGRPVVRRRWTGEKNVSWSATV